MAWTLRKQKVNKKLGQAIMHQGLYPVIQVLQWDSHSWTFHSHAKPPTRNLALKHWACGEHFTFKPHLFVVCLLMYSFLHLFVYLFVYCGTGGNILDFAHARRALYNWAPSLASVKTHVYTSSALTSRILPAANIKIEANCPTSLDDWQNKNQKTKCHCMPVTLSFPSPDWASLSCP